MPRRGLYGKLAPERDRRTLRLERYLQFSLLPTPPASYNWATNITSWPAMGNLTIGDCTIAAAGHLIEEWTADESGNTVIVPDSEILAAYSAVSGYVPGKPKTDIGASCLRVLKYWRKTGIGGNKIQAFTSFELKNAALLETAVYVFGGAYIGLAMPLSARNQTTWSVPPQGTRGRGKPGSWGGHCVPIVGYNSLGLTVVSWGALYQMTWPFWQTYCDEQFAIISPQWYAKNQVTPVGFNLTQLQSDLTGLAA